VLPIAVANDIDAIGGAYNDGITWRRGEMGRWARNPTDYLE